MMSLAMAQSGHVVQISKPASDADRVQALDLETGKSFFFSTDFRVRRVSVGDPKILDVVVLSPTELQLVPSAVGATNVVLWDSSGAPAVVIDASIGSSFTHIERRLRSVLDSDDIHVSSAGKAVVLQGSVPSPVHVERAIAIAQAFFDKEGDQKVVNALDVGGNQQVMIEVVIAEMTRTLGKQLAVNWDAAIASGNQFFTIQNFLSDLIALDDDGASSSLLVSDRVDLLGSFVNGNVFALNYFIDAATNSGLAKVLAKPTLLARSGQKASFLAGGEVPIPIAPGGAFGSITIEFKQFGVGVEFAPTVLGGDRIHLEVSPEVSEPDFNIGAAVGGSVTPGFITRRASTSVELGDGQSFAIAGLLQDNVAEAVEKYPLLGDVPILGALFRSVRYQKKETELVLIVTPRLVKPLPAGEFRLPTDSFVEPSDFEFYLLGAMEAQREGDSDGTQSAGLVGPSGHRLPVAMEENAR
jgi:pilus assembly protein CpaC